MSTHGWRSYFLMLGRGSREDNKAMKTKVSGVPWPRRRSLEIRMSGRAVRLVSADQADPDKLSMRHSHGHRSLVNDCTSMFYRSLVFRFIFTFSTFSRLVWLVLSDHQPLSSPPIYRPSRPNGARPILINNLPASRSFTTYQMFRSRC